MFDECKRGSNDHTTNRDPANTNAPAITAEDNVPARCVAVATLFRFLVIKLDRKARHDV
jgi:hypothetical protein